MCKIITTKSWQDDNIGMVQKTVPKAYEDALWVGKKKSHKTVTNRLNVWVLQVPGQQNLPDHHRSPRRLLAIKARYFPR